ncbi:MAG: hypothetical protein OXE92_03255 [Bacteroidetes bacterium]|nr:hypothetical protein [Bacteroidota bacterium]
MDILCDIGRIPYILVFTGIDPNEMDHYTASPRARHLVFNCFLSAGFRINLGLQNGKAPS